MKNLKPNVRITSQGRALETRRWDSLKTADRTAQVTHKQVIRVATTYDNGKYPPDPAFGTGGPPDPERRKTPHRLPIIFDDIDFPLTAGQGSATAVPMKTGGEMTIAQCNEWHESGTKVILMHQNQRWLEVGGAGFAPQQENQHILIALAELAETGCVENIPDDYEYDFLVVRARGIAYCPFDIFQIPWMLEPAGDWNLTGEYPPDEPIDWEYPPDEPIDPEYPPPDPIETETGDRLIAEQVDPVGNIIVIFWEGRDDDEFLVENPMHICGQDGDTIILHYQGEDRLPLLMEVRHHCQEVVRSVQFDDDTCTLGYRETSICAPTSAEDNPFEPPTTIIDFEVQTLLTDWGYDPSMCTFYNVYEDFCVIRVDNTEQTLHVLDTRDIRDPCCPCPECPDDCSTCYDTIRVHVQSWSTHDCDCMNLWSHQELVLDRLTNPPCEWDSGASSNPICPAGGVSGRIYCRDYKWFLYIDYSTAGENNNVWTHIEIELGDVDPFDPCPPLGNYTVADDDWQFDAGSHVCTQIANNIDLLAGAGPGP